MNFIKRFFSTYIEMIQFSSVAQSSSTLCDPMNHCKPGLPVPHQLPESTQTHVHWVGDAIQPSHPLLSPSPPAFNLSQYQGVCKWVSFSHQVAKVLEFQLQYQSFQWTNSSVYLWRPHKPAFWSYFSMKLAFSAYLGGGNLNQFWLLFFFTKSLIEC